jgi:hypothetical protein
MDVFHGGEIMKLKNRKFRHKLIAKTLGFLRPVSSWELTDEMVDVIRQSQRSWKEQFKTAKRWGNPEREIPDIDE